MKQVIYKQDEKDGRDIIVCPYCGKTLFKIYGLIESIRPIKKCKFCGKEIKW